MAVYTFYMHEGADGVPAFEIAQFDDPKLALAHGEQLLRDRPRYRLIEVTCEDQNLARLVRSNEAASAAS